MKKERKFNKKKIACGSAIAVGVAGLGVLAGKLVGNKIKSRGTGDINLVTLKENSLSEDFGGTEESKNQ